MCVSTAAWQHAKPTTLLLAEAKGNAPKHRLPKPAGERNLEASTREASTMDDTPPR